MYIFFFFFNDTATPQIYTLSLHDALPIYPHGALVACCTDAGTFRPVLFDPAYGPAINRSGSLGAFGALGRDRKSTRLNSSHVEISYAVFCLKKKKNENYNAKEHQRVNPAI